MASIRDLAFMTPEVAEQLVAVAAKHKPTNLDNFAKSAASVVVCRHGDAVHIASGFSKKHRRPYPALWGCARGANGHNSCGTIPQDSIS